MTLINGFTFLLAQEVISYCLLGKASFRILWFLKSEYSKKWLYHWVQIKYRACILYELDHSNLISLSWFFFWSISCIIVKYTQDKCWPEGDHSLNIIDHSHFLLHLISPTFCFKIHLFPRESRKMQSCLKENCASFFLLCPSSTNIEAALSLKINEAFINIMLCLCILWNVFIFNELLILISGNRNNWT